MSSLFGVFSRTDEPAVLSLEVQARMQPKEVEIMNRFVVLVRLFFLRFFSNEITAEKEQDGTRIVQVLSALALPGLVFALQLTPSYLIFPPNTMPRGFWPRISDHYFCVMFSMVVVGATTVFEWDMLFPDLLDVLILTPLPILNRKLFAAKITALGVFLGQFLLAGNVFAGVMLPLIADEPSFLRHLMAHGIAVSLSGLFAAAFFVALQGILLNLVGEHMVRALSPVLQGVSLAILLIVLFLFPVLSHDLRPLLLSNNSAVQWFPPFWFLGIYECLLRGTAALAVFHALAFTGCWTTLLVVGLAVITYPLAYRRKTRRIIEGNATKHNRNRLAEAKDALLHALLRRPEQRAVYHFIGHTLKRVPRHRVYLSLYGGFGLALLLAVTVNFKVEQGHIHLVFSEPGLLAATPLAAFWIVLGMKAAFMSPVSLRANWIFHTIGGHFHADRVTATQHWTVLRAAVLTVCISLIACMLSPTSWRDMHHVIAQILVAEALSLLLVDGLFLQWLSVPFTAPLTYSKRNLAFLVPVFLLLFPLYIEKTVQWGIWIERSLMHFVAALALVLVMHAALLYFQQRLIREHAGWPVLDEEEEFPRRLGLL